MVFLDSSPVIHFVEQPPRWGAKAAARIATFRGAGAQLVVSDLVRMETVIGPLKANDPVRLADFATFFAAPHVTVLSITATVCDWAARIRAQYGFKPLDALHLAAAVEHGCTHFLSNDAKLKKFPDVVVEILA